MICSTVSIYELCKTLYYWSRDILNCNFPEKGLGLITTSHFVHDFSKKSSLCYILITDNLLLSECQYMFQNWLLTRLWRHKTYNPVYLSNQVAPTIIFIIFWHFLMFCQVFLSSQVKKCEIITYKHGIYELPYELPKD